MISVLFAFLIVLSFSIGSLIGFLAGNGVLLVKFDLATWVGALSTLLGAIATVGALYVAKRGMNTWREQQALNTEEKLLVNINQLHVNTYIFISMLNNKEAKLDQADLFLFNDLLMSVMKIKTFCRIYQAVVADVSDKILEKLNNLQELLIKIRNNLIKDKSINTVTSIKNDIKYCREIIQDIEELVIQITNKNNF